MAGAVSLSGDGVSLVPATGGGGSSPVQTTGKIALTNDQLLHLFSSPITIIPAPGAGKAILPTQISYVYDFVTTPFTLLDAPPSLYYGSVGGVAIGNGATDIYSQTVSSIASEGNAGGTNPLASIANQPVVFTEAAFNMTDGDGTGSIEVFYTVIDL